MIKVKLLALVQNDYKFVRFKLNEIYEKNNKTAILKFSYNSVYIL